MGLRGLELFQGARRTVGLGARVCGGGSCRVLCPLVIAAGFSSTVHLLLDQPVCSWGQSGGLGRQPGRSPRRRWIKGGISPSLPVHFVPKLKPPAPHLSAQLTWDVGVCLSAKAEEQPSLCLPPAVSGCKGAGFGRWGWSFVESVHCAVRCGVCWACPRWGR